MSVVAVSLTGKGSPRVRVFESMEEARNTGNGFSLYASATDMAKDYRILSFSDLVEIQRLVAPPKERWKVDDPYPTRIECSVAVWDAVIKNVNQQESVMAKAKAAVVEVAPKKAKKAVTAGAAVKERAPRAPKVSAHAGKRLIAKMTLEETGRRPEASRGQAFSIIAATGKKGIKFEDYVAKGGEPRYVDWFLEADQIGVS
jgi:hypothetical protein